MQAGANPYGAGMNNPYGGYANPEMAQLAAMLGSMNQNNGNNNMNNINAYLPYIISQGASNPDSAKQMMQAMMMSQMMPEFGFGSNNSNGGF